MKCQGLILPEMGSLRPSTHFLAALWLPGQATPSPALGALELGCLTTLSPGGPEMDVSLEALQMRGQWPRGQRQGAAVDHRLHSKGCPRQRGWEPWPLRPPSPGPAVTLQKLSGSSYPKVSSELLCPLPLAQPGLEQP